jgi:LDH2 family malate/lactate/ureidoglycolate dehydrogenase
MLEQFHVPEEIAYRVQHDTLRDTCAELLETAGLPVADARLAADVLVASDLRGVETHGVSNLMSSYITGLGNGHLNPHPNMRIVRESPACATIDSDAGMGVVIAPKAMEIAIEKGKATGAGLVTIANGRHLGMAGYHAMMALEHDMIGQCMTACGPSFVPTFAAEAAIGTNPIAIAAPAGEEPPFVFDAAMSILAANKITLAKRLGVDLEPGWIANPDGTPITEAGPVPDEYMLLPAGSTRELGSHKAYSLGVVVDILGGLLNGSPAGPMAPRGKNNHFLAAYDIDAFIDVQDFKKGMDEYLRALRNLKPAPGHDRVFYAGLPEHEETAKRKEHGIPLHPEVIDWFRSACSELGVEFRL